MSQAIPEKTLLDLGWPALAEHLARRCHTTRGADAARTLRFFDHPEPARARIAEVAEARLLTQLDAAMPFADVHDVRTLLDRVAKGGDLTGVELVSVGETVAGCARLRRHLVAHAAQAPRLAHRVEPLQELSHVSGPILDSFEPGGRLADHASAALGPMRRRVRELHDELGRRVRDLLDDPEIAPYLQDRFYTQRDERYVVPLRADARARVRGIVHGTSQSGQTVFVEPEAVLELNNRLKMAESDVEEEERRILAELSGYVREEVDAIRAAGAIVTTVDVIDGAARLAEATAASPPELGDPGTELELRRARHPLMELGGRPCVPNDVAIAPGTTLVVSGPNAGGKTVVLKTVGLAALMARTGLHVAADEGSRVPWYDLVETDVGDDQSLERNLSTFSAHVLHLNELLARAGRATLYLIDEVAVGTEPEQGAALAQAVLEALAARGAQGVVTTHYERLKALAVRDGRFVNASVGFDLERMAPTFRLHLGVPGSSGALLVARRLGLPPDIAARADVLLGDRRAGIEELLTAAAEERRRLDAERAAAETARREADRARHEAEATERDWRARLEKLRRGAHDEAVAALRRTRDELDALRRRLKDTGGRAELEAARAELRDAAGRLAAQAPAPDELPGRPATPDDLVAGAAVIVPRLGGRGKVVAPPERGRVTVLIGSLRTTVAVDEVRLDDRSARHLRRAARAAGVAVAVAPTRRGPGGAASAGGNHRAAAEADDEELAPARTPDATLDVRGERADDAVAQVDRFLDDSMLAPREVVFVIHGHGTGALRSAIRAHIASHPGVARWRPGQEKEGGEGVTVIWLDV